MNVSVILGQHYLQKEDGTFWTETVAAYDFWKRYLDIFDGVNVIARTKSVASLPDQAKRADGPGVHFTPLPEFLGPWQFLQKALSVRRIIAAECKGANAIIWRGSDSTLVGSLGLLVRSGRPYAVEVIGDPYDVFSPGASTHFFRPFFRWWFTRMQKRHCASACGCAYVTEHALQRRYPAASKAMSTHYSSVELPVSACKASARRFEKHKERYVVISVGGLGHLYKAPDVLIDAVASCVRQGMDLELRMVGDGNCRPMLESQESAVYLGRRLRFLGQLSGGKRVQEALDQADLFVLPSRQEGLPRAMIEAMARGLPCIGSMVGGIPELLPQEDMVPPGDIPALAAKIQEFVSSPERMATCSQRNLEIARQYQDSILRSRRREFYRHVRLVTEAWLRHRNIHSASQTQSNKSRRIPARPFAGGSSRSPLS